MPGGRYKSRLRVHLSPIPLISVRSKDIESNTLYIGKDTLDFNVNKVKASVPYGMSEKHVRYHVTLIFPLI